MPRKRQEFEVPDQLRRSQPAMPYEGRIKLAIRGKPEGELWNKHLSPHQKREALATGWVPVRGSNSGMFCVCVDPHGNAQVVSKARTGGWTSHCLVVSGEVSMMDAALAKIMLIEADEQLFRKTAR